VFILTIESLRKNHKEGFLNFCVLKSLRPNLGIFGRPHSIFWLNSVKTISSVALTARGEQKNRITEKTGKIKKKKNQKNRTKKKPN
jgi:hypothetical protein